MSLQTLLQGTICSGHINFGNIVRVGIILLPVGMDFIQYRISPPPKKKTNKQPMSGDLPTAYLLPPLQLETGE